MFTVARGKFRMLSPIRSVQGPFYIIGAVVGTTPSETYSVRLPMSAKRDDMRRAYGQLREKIHKEHPGVKEEFTIYRPKVSYN